MRFRTGSVALSAVLCVISSACPPAQRQFEEWLGRIPVDRNDSDGLAVFDVDGDSDLDIVFGNYGAVNSLYLNDGTGTFRDVSATHMPSVVDYPLDLAVGDVDGDGDPDLVMANAGVCPSGGCSRQNGLFLNDGSGRFSDFTAWLPTDSDFTASVALGDVDGDDDLDIVFGNRSVFGSKQNRLYLNDGTGRFINVTGARLPVELNDTAEVVLADVDGDTDLDLVTANAAPRPQTRLFLNDGTGFFSNVTESRMPIDNDESDALALVDVDGDSDLDMVIGNNGQQDRLYLNDGTGTFSDGTAGRMPPDSAATTGVALADVDGDSDLDMALCAWPGPTRLYLGNGTGSFIDATSRIPPDSDLSSQVALEDVDGDADPDLVIANHSPENRLYTNLHRQLSAPLGAALSQSYVLDLHAKPGYGSSPHTGAVVLGVAKAPTPLPLPPLGTFYLAPPLLPLPLVAILPSGIGALSLQIPGNPALVGVPLHSQALILNQASPADAHFTGYVVDVIR